MDPQLSAGSACPEWLAAYGWNPAVHARYQPFSSSETQLVRIVRVDRASCVVVTADGVAECRLGATDPSPVTGDWAAARRTEDGVPVLDAVLPRTTTVARRNAAASGEQVLVANVDGMLVLHGIDRPHRVGRLERLAILSWEAGVDPVIVLTKIDLRGTADASIDVGDAIAEIRKVIHEVDIVATSTATGEGVDQLAPYLAAGRTFGIVGESGAGKSSLVNHLAGSAVQPTGATRRRDHKGRHTTTSRDLVPVPGGAVLIDTPGLRSVCMPVAREGLARSYADLEAFAANCRFRDCAHGVEPGCGVRAAIERGLLTAERWAGYQKLQREMAFEARRVEVRARRSERRRSRRRPSPADDAESW